MAPDRAAPQAAEDTANLYRRKSLQAVRIVGSKPEIDGKLDESVWQLSPAGTDFLQHQPNPGQPSSQKTEIRFAYDDNAVYVGARMYDTRPDSIVAQLARRDWLLGSAPSLADFACFHCVWFLRNDPETFAEVERRPRLREWFERVEALGQGDRTDLGADEAVIIGFE